MAKTKQPKFDDYWTEMSPAKKLDLFSAILSYAATNLDFRERCLASGTSAVAAISESFGVGFPRDFSICFIDPHDCRQETNRIIVRLPKWAGEGQDIEIPANQTNVPCTYDQWRRFSKKRTKKKS